MGAEPTTSPESSAERWARLTREADANWRSDLLKAASGADSRHGDTFGFMPVGLDGVGGAEPRAGIIRRRVAELCRRLADVSCADLRRDLRPVGAFLGCALQWELDPIAAELIGFIHSTALGRVARAKARGEEGDEAARAWLEVGQCAGAIRRDLEGRSDLGDIMFTVPPLGAYLFHLSAKLEAEQAAERAAKRKAGPVRLRGERGRS